MGKIERLFNTLLKEGLFEAYIVWNNKEYILTDQKLLIKDLKKSVSTEKLITSVIDKKKEAIQVENEKHDWKVAQNMNTGRSYNQYLEKYPLGMFIDQARARIKLLESDQDAWEDAAGVNTLKSYNGYLLKYTDGLFVEQAKKRINKLEEKKLQVEKKEKTKKQKETEKIILEKRVEKISLKPELKEVERPIFYKERNKRKAVFGMVFTVVFLVAVTFVIMQFVGEKSTPDIDTISDVKPKDSIQETPDGLNNQVETKKDLEESDYLAIKKKDLDKKDISQLNEDKKKKELKPKAIEKDKATTIKPKKEVAEKYKKTAQLYDLKQEIRKKIQLNEEKNNQQYKEYLNLARIYYRGGIFDQALENINKARKLKESKELDNLENEILHKIKTEKKEKEIRTIKLFDVQQYLSQNYYNTIKHLEILNVDPENKIGGQVFVKLKISEDGRVSVQSFNNSRLNVNPENQKGFIDRLIKKALSSVILSPPKDKMGKTVRVENWPVTFEVGKFRNKIVLNIVH